MGFTAAILILVACLAPVVAWAIYRWKKLKPELFSKAELMEESPLLAAGNRAINIRPETVICLLGMAEALLDQEDTPENREASRAIKQLITAAGETGPAIEALIQESLEKAELTSLLLGEDGTYTYLVVAPNRHDHAHLIGRYPPFSAGWRHHAELVRSSLMASGAFRGLTSLLFFLSPDGKDSIARVAFAGPESMLIPSALAQGEDMNAPEIRILDASFEFSLSA